MKQSKVIFQLIIISLLTFQCSKKDIAPSCNLNTQALLGENNNLCSSAVVDYYSFQNGFEEFRISVDHGVMGRQVIHMVVPDSVILGDTYNFAYGHPDPLTFSMANFDSDLSGTVTISKIDRTSNLLSFKFEMFGNQESVFDNVLTKAPISIIGTTTDLHFE